MWSCRGNPGLVPTLARPSDATKEEAGEGKSETSTLGNGSGEQTPITGAAAWFGPWLSWAAPSTAQEPAQI